MTLLIAAGIALVAAAVGALGNWLPRPPRLRTRSIIFAMAGLALVSGALEQWREDRSGADTGTSAGPTPGRSPGPSSAGTRTRTARASASSHPAALSQSEDPSPGTVADPPRIEEVNVASAGDYRRVGPGLYQLKGSPALEVRYNWSTVTNYGKPDSSDRSCAVQITVRNTGTGRTADSARTTTCSLENGWYSSNLPEGSYKVTVAVTLSSGSRGSGGYSFRIIP